MSPAEIRDLLAILQAAGVSSFKLGDLEVHLRPPAPAAEPPRPVADAQDAALAALMDLAGKGDLG